MELTKSLVCFIVFIFISGAEVASQVVNGILGGSVSFYESVPIQANPAITWTFNNAIIAQRFPSGTPVCVGQYAGRCDLSENGTLRLDNLRFADDGDYTMTAQYPNLTVIKRSTYTLRVYISSQVVNGILGGSVYFYESVPIQANPAITWNFNNAIIAQRFPSGTPACVGQYAGRCGLSGNGTLRLDNLRFADDGNYTMTAQYPNTTVIKESTHTLRVYNVLSTPVLSSNVTSNSLINGTDVSLHCDAGNQTVTTYTFYRDGKNICAEPHVTCRDSNFYFQPITESDSGRYACIIQNPVSTSTSNTLQLSVSDVLSTPVLSSNVTSNSLISGTYVSLHCNAGSQTVTTYAFYCDGKNICAEPHVTCSDSNLYFQPITESDSGSYTCTIQNPVSSNNSNTLRLSVSDVLSAPVLRSYVSADRLINGTYVSLHCDAGSQTVTTYTFYRDGKNICAELHVTCRDSELYFQPITESDSGSYTCTIQNPVSTSTSNTLQLSVSAPCKCPECHGLGGGEVAGIVIGVVAVIIIIEVIVFFVLKAKRKTPSGNIYENSNIPPQHIYSTTLPGAEMKSAHQEPHYEQLKHKNRSLYNDLGLATRKQ